MEKAVLEFPVMMCIRFCHHVSLAWMSIHSWPHLLDVALLPHKLDTSFERNTFSNLREIH